MKNINKLFLFTILSWTLGNAQSSPVYLSSYAIEDGITNTFGGGIQSSGFHGIRFQVNGEIHLTGISAFMYGNGNYFGAITQVVDAQDLPSISLNNVATESLAYNTGIFSSTAQDNLLNLDITLSTGHYVAFFGGLGVFGAQDSGIIPIVDNPNLSQIPTNDYIINSGGTWLEAPSEVVRIEILADTITTVPLPSSIFLMLSGCLLGYRFIKRKT